MEKELFYNKMKPYFDKGMVREIYNSESGVIFSFGETNYVACPYQLIDNSPIGIYVNERTIKKIVEDEPYMLGLINYIFNDPYKYRSLIYNLSPNKIDDWKKWVADILKKSGSEINYQLEEEIQQMSKNKSR